MGIIRFEGLDELIVDLGGIEDLPVEGMLNAAADVVVAAQKRTAGTMLQGKYNKGAVVAAIRKGNITRKAGSASIRIEFPGQQHGTPIATIAFVNEFGKTNQPARPFIATANEGCADQAEGAAVTAYDTWLRTKGL